MTAVLPMDWIVADIGSGTGLSTRIWADRADEVIGVDLDEEPLKLARENANLNQVRVRFVQADAFIYTGIASTFAKAGFVEVARRSETRPIMRLNTMMTPK